MGEGVEGAKVAATELYKEAKLVALPGLVEIFCPPVACAYVGCSFSAAAYRAELTAPLRAA